MIYKKYIKGEKIEAPKYNIGDFVYGIKRKGQKNIRRIISIGSKQKKEGIRTFFFCCKTVK